MVIAEHIFVEVDLLPRPVHTSSCVLVVFLEAQSFVIVDDVFDGFQACVIVRCFLPRDVEPGGYRSHASRHPERLVNELLSEPVSRVHGMRADGRDVQFMFVLVHIGQKKRDDPVDILEVQHEIGTSEGVRHVLRSQFRVAQTIVLDILQDLELQILPERTGFRVCPGEPRLERPGIPGNVDTYRNIDVGRPRRPI